MKKAIIGILSLIMVFCLVGCGTKGENITSIVTTDNMVFFDPKCPDCKHIGYGKVANICKGESYKGIHQCEKCGEIFDISVQR